jgi:hypothetical protein
MASARPAGGASFDHLTTITGISEIVKLFRYFQISLNLPRFSRIAEGSNQPASILATMKPEPAPVPAPGQVDAPQR